jgi:hypothetical protein
MKTNPAQKSDTPQAPGFPCAKCGTEVLEIAAGTRNRNHCPHCLHSLHVAVDLKQDDRTSTCRQIMEPIAIFAQKDGEWALVHRCLGCGNIKTNRIAGDDDTVALLCLALRPLERLPFPLDQVLFEAKSKMAGLT